MLAAAVCIVGAILTQPPPGPHMIAEGRVYVNLPSGDGHMVDVYYPEDLDNGPYPLVSFAHGMFAGGQLGRPTYFNLMIELASHGLIVVAPESCQFSYCEEFWKDQLGAINACHNTSMHKAFAHINFETIGVIGHAMGGQATEQSASHAEGYNLKAAVALNPISKVEWAEQIHIPIMYSTGTLDEAAPPATVKAAYDATNVEKGTMFVNLNGAGHYEPTNLGKHSLNRYAALFMSCYVGGRSSDCAWVGKEFCTNSGLDFAECVHKQ
eukprot:TRINITY_DN10518_c1_g1_i1.p1 TRINITY_DN10518_c1_g1~~TRINITY_DN10518_c1_g1_i1.p1  ORF type:complete len:292 (+),score=61.93 TRINITY_DN10518_c1_g1_i1:77-877(+)